MLQPFETHSVRMENILLITVQAPTEDMDRIASAVGKLTPLLLGKYDQNTFETATGLERYRPLEGAAAGAETELRKRPGVATLSFQIPFDSTLLEEIVECIFQTHSYQEPVIILQ